MALVGFVDWRGNAIRKEVHGGVRAAWFLYVLTVVTNVVIIPNLLNLVTYLHGTMHMGVSASATTTTNFFGATSGVMDCSHCKPTFLHSVHQLATLKQS
uniref:Uncharacterized protein n=1 Tax=Aegilops tauschii subsp. strangulata TaxID=200361 RepID=A0A453CAH1_AEGTS